MWVAVYRWVCGCGKYCIRVMGRARESDNGGSEISIKLVEVEVAILCGLARTGRSQVITCRGYLQVSR